MSKSIAALFGVLTLVAILTIAPSAFADTAQVTITKGASASQNCVAAKNCFDPNTVNVSVGGTVTWTNADTASHTATYFDGNMSDSSVGTVWDSGLIKAGSTYTTLAFTKAGTYPYFCQVHPWMTGQIIVGAAVTTTSTTPNNTSSTTTPSNPAPSNPAPSTSTTTGASLGYSDSDDPSGPLQMTGWGVGIAIAAILSGIGIWSSVRSR